MQSVTKYHRRKDENPGHNILWILQAVQYTEGLDHSEMESSFLRQDAQGPWARMREAQSGPKPCNLVPRAHVPFGQHQDTELWNNQQARSQSLRGFCF